jgi:UDP-glucose 4-epimerase
MHYLITGGAGFIGSHLSERLATMGARVTVLDDLSFGRRRNLHAAERHAGFRCVVGSVTDSALLRRLAADADAIVHLAAVIGVERVSRRPLPSLLGNLAGTLGVLRVAARRQLPVLLASSSEVYGQRAECAREDDAVCLGPTQDARWGYAGAKAMEEWLAFAYAQGRDLPVRIVRFFNVAGPRQRQARGAVIPRLVWQAVHGRPLRVHGDGQQTRCFCHVSDAVECLVRLLWTERARGEVVNVGSTQEVSILQLAERVRTLAGVDVPITFLPRAQAHGRGADVQRRLPDLGKLRALVEYEPSTPLDTIVRDVLRTHQRVATTR